jgi:hypothetical protein
MRMTYKVVEGLLLARGHDDNFDFEISNSFLS